MPQRQTELFPKRFLWGVSSSAHQVEGGNHNQWSVWELENAKVLAAQASYHYDDLANWPQIKDRAIKPTNYVSGRATDHYRRYKDDIALVRRMHMNAFRLSIEWSRVEPQEGAWNIEAIEHYRAVLKECHTQGVEPIVTLFHFTLPVWFTEKGGFEHARNIRYFVEFATRISHELGSLVRYVITMNEPEVYVRQSYMLGQWPPQQTNQRMALRVLWHLTQAHHQVAKALHQESRRYNVSFSKNYSYIYPGDDAWLSIRAVEMKQYADNTWFLRRMMKSCDFIGVNYYFSDRVYGYRVHNPDDTVNDLGWDMQPQYLSRALEELYDAYHKPLLVTENGLADERDEQRIWWLTQSIAALQKSIKAGIPVIGYLHWSLTDNFEWDKGFWPRFGLFAVNYKTMERAPRKSAIWLANTLKKIRG